LLSASPEDDPFEKPAASEDIAAFLLPPFATEFQVFWDRRGTTVARSAARRREAIIQIVRDRCQEYRDDKALLEVLHQALDYVNQVLYRNKYEAVSEAYHTYLVDKQIWLETGKFYRHLTPLPSHAAALPHLVPLRAGRYSQLRNPC
jgi:hypothetical protein